MMLFVLGVLLLGGAAALAVRAATMADVQTAERLAEIDSYGFAADTGTHDFQAAGMRGVLDGLAERMGRAIAARFEAAEPAARSQLMAAGRYTTAPTTFLGYRAMAAASGAVFLLWLAGSTGHSGTTVLFATAFGAFAGWVLPQTVMRRRAEHRMGQIELGLPELIDLLVVTVEAGLGFSSSMQLAATKLHGALGEELRLALQEQRMGLSTTEALSSMLARCDTPSMRSFVRSVIQGETLGVSIGTIMRNLAIEMRKRRRQAAEERAQKAPIKMLFPLVFLIFPPMFMVLLYPAIHTFGQSFGG
jgi:tight adherence protein C